MAQTDDLKAYRKRWDAVNAIQKEERLNSSIILRWQQLNSIFGMAQGLGIIQPDLSEIGVYERWAKLKENLTSPKVERP